MNLIEIADNQEDWQSAIKRGVALLVNQNIALDQLANSIIKSTEKLGPYYVVMPKVALAHTRPGNYNKKIGISLVVYKQPIKFSDLDRHKVNLLFVLSATDENSHMDLLSNFAQVMSRKNIVSDILAAKNKKEIFALIKEVL